METHTCRANAIFCQPPPEEEDRLCVVKTGHTVAELKTKAISNPDGLTRDEATIVHHPPSVLFPRFKSDSERKRSMTSSRRSWTAPTTSSDATQTLRQSRYCSMRRSVNSKWPTEKRRRRPGSMQSRYME
ncbi:hypothetical protein BT67DRAFT_440225 [Trichocladium antarcticum]|uniref:Uncharacterized protein n=1 Tax=Trichocladium antarcticum TaxID=1450529 RepID=A0AAN6ZFK4_9PEZI|nr:hypothetical protein BT67DRAFT_440225 [Trichocladium antarcticum]